MINLSHHTKISPGLMKLYSLPFLLIFSFASLYATAQEYPPIQNFSTTDYNSGNQNWSITQSGDKLIYVANNDGLLEFNGSVWKSYPSPNETVMRSATVIGNKVYTGCYMEFGFWERDELGLLNYNSLSQTLELNLVEDEEFWNIFEIDGWVVFQSLRRIYIYNPGNGSLNVIESVETIVKMYEVDGRIYFQRKGKGIFQLINGQDRLLSAENVFLEDEVANIFPYGESLLVLTRHNGFYVLNNTGNIRKISTELDSQDDLSIYSAIQLRGGGFALGTISHGLMLLDEKFMMNLQISQQNGLSNNTVLHVFEDHDSNVWMGLDNGISYININSPIRVFKDQNGVLGSVYASALYDGILYLGTNQGLFYKNAASDDAFEFIDGTQGQVWSLKILDGRLFCGHHAGTFIVEKGKPQKIADIQGTWHMEQLSDRLILQGNYDGLYLLEKGNSKWTFRNKLNGFDNSSRSFAVLDNRIFVNHEYKGVFELTVDASFRKVVDTKVDTLLRGANSSITKYKDEVCYACKEGILTYEPSLGKFMADSILSALYSEDEYVSGRIIPSMNGEQIWLFTRDNLMLISAGNLADIPKVERIPLTLEIRNNVVEYENIIAVDGVNRYLLGTTFGYLIFDSNRLEIPEFNVYINTISSGINEDHSASGIRIDKSLDGDFSSDENNLKISYHTPQYIKYFTPSYQYRLDGLYDAWSEWTTTPEVFYENLPPGNYTFSVRAKIADKLSENTANYEFYIAKPWYRTNFMIIIYLLGVVAFSIFMHNVYRAYYKKQQAHIMEENRKELELTRLQNEQEIMKLKNDQLEKDFKRKSNELAASTMSIIKKNELLTQIKEQLSTIEDKTAIKPVIKTIDKSLNHNENWEMFKEAFDNADAEFFKNLKSLHPNLSPNDLKLCAYLRLNLSSKEVSQLINISPRSVEVKRYRLRKKLNLDTNENLADYILSI